MTDNKQQILDSINNLDDNVLAQLARKTPILRHFRFGHLPPNLQFISRKFAEVAVFTVVFCPGDDAETHAGLRKILEAKDCAVRSQLA
jgi:hypothetical protein